MATPHKSEVTDKVASAKAAKAGPSVERASFTAKKTVKNDEKNSEVNADGANATKKQGAGYRPQSHPYANSFRKVMADWMSVNFPDEARHKNTWPSELGKRRPRSAVEQGPMPNLVQYLGWLDSLEDRDEASANNTSTKRHWQKFCEQEQNKKMVASWMEFARDIRTADGLLKFRPAFGHVNSSISPGGRLHPLISFPSAGEFKDITNAGLGRQNDDGDDCDGNKEVEAGIRPVVAAGNRRAPAAPTKRPRQDTQGEDDDNSGDAGRCLAKKPRNAKTATPVFPSSRSASVLPKRILFTAQIPQLNQKVDEAIDQLQLDHPEFQRQFDS